MEALSCLTGAALTEAVNRADLVLDCTDHFAIRDELNEVLGHRDALDQRSCPPDRRAADGV